MQERKLSSPIGDVVIVQYDGHESTIYNLRMTEGYNWCSELPLSTNVSIYGAVMAQKRMLVNVEDDVAYIEDESAMVSVYIAR